MPHRSLLFGITLLLAFFLSTFWVQSTLFGLTPKPKPTPQTQVPSKASKQQFKTSKQQSKPQKMQGITLSCFGMGAVWATSKMYKTMKRISKLGVNWIAYHPYASIQNNGSLSYSRSLQQSSVINPIRFGKKLGVKTLLKPHIAHWGSKFGWRGDISFQKESEWKRFFRNYTDWITIQAQIAQNEGADLFSIGIEYQKTLHRVQDWRNIIKSVRKVYKGKILYSANWDVYKKVRFWDALDYVGIQAYFPISTQKNPSENSLRKGWKKIITKLKVFSKTIKKPIIFTELGYNRAAHAAAKPWDHTQGGKKAGEIKLRCIKVALEELKKESFIHGIFLWKWFPVNWNISSNYTLQYPAMKKVIHSIWSKP